MKRFLLDNSINLIKKNSNYDDVKLDEIRYGLEGIYLTLTKLIIIIVLSMFFGILKEVIIFTVFYNFIRMFAFGLHASKSIYCLISSSIVFLLFPYLSTVLEINFYLKLLIGISCISLIFMYAPADTKKRPLINKNKRFRFKILSTIVAVTYVIASIFINNIFISNCLIFTLLTETVLVLPITYKLFKMSYSNYKTYGKVPRFDSGLNLYLNKKEVKEG